MITQRAGRPRKHDSDAGRVRAFREAHGLQKITADVPAEFTEQLRQYARLLRQFARQRAVPEAAVPAMVIRPTRKRPSRFEDANRPATANVDLELTRNRPIHELIAQMDISSLRWQIIAAHRLELNWHRGDTFAVVRRGEADERCDWVWYVVERRLGLIAFPVRGRDNNLRRAKLLAETALLAYVASIYEGTAIVDAVLGNQQVVAPAPPNAEPSQSATPRNPSPARYSRS
jgi:hypothetical protein